MSDPARPLEILVVSHYYAGQGGGVERVAGRLIGDIAGQGGFHFTWAASEQVPVHAIAGQALAPMRAFDLRIGGAPWPVWTSLGRLYEAVRRADIVWLHDSLYMGNIAAFWMAKRLRKPVVITQHIAPVPYRRALPRVLMALADRLIGRRMLARANQAVFVSDAVADFYYRRVAFTAPVKIIPNGVDVETFRPAVSEQRRYLRNRFALLDDEPIVLFVGRFVEKKGLPVLKHLARLLPGWHFWLAGAGPIDPEKWFFPNVHVFRNCRDAALAELYQAADLLILPSYGEGFPLVIQEAMACGLPVMCSPATAAGSRPAKPYLLMAEVFPRDPARTATLWAERLKIQRAYLPLPGPQMDLSRAAAQLWPWPVIAGHYADIFRGLVRRRS